MQPCEKDAMKSTSMAEARVAFLLLSASGMAMITAGIFLASAGEAPKAPLEEWVAPARAARKQNPAPADAKSVAQGRELYVAGCLPCHGPAGKGDGSAAATLERDGKPIRPGNLSDSKLWQQVAAENGQVGRSTRNQSNCSG